MTTPVDQLRAAARTLRTLLADRDLTPGPWLSMDRGDRVLWDGQGAEDLPPVYVVDEPMSNGANADYIAVMHPDVGHAVADWLDAEAAIWEAVETTKAEYGPQGLKVTMPLSTHAQALAVARAITRTAGGERG